MKKQKRKIFLFTNQCTAHPQEVDILQNIKIIFFFPNCTSRLQPLDLEIIKNVKDYYSKKLIQLAIGNMTEGTNLRKLNILQAINMISESWAQVISKTIINCFVKVGFSDSHMKLM